MRQVQSIHSVAFAMAISLTLFACSDSSSGDDNEVFSSSLELNEESSSSAEELSSSSSELNEESSSSVEELSSSSSELNEDSSSSSEDLSSSSEAESSSSDAESSSSEVSDLCAEFDPEAEVEHYGKNKKQICDARDGKTYRTVEIGTQEKGTQTWMAENLNFATESGSWCYEEKEENCDIYGRLYDWATAMNINVSYNTSTYTAEAKHQGVCPTGWHLPSNDEWTTLTDFASGLSTAGTKLKAKSGLWNTNTGTDDYGFSALPGGNRSSSGIFGSNVGDRGYWWSATQYDTGYAYYRRMAYNSADVYRGNVNKALGYSVRCVQD